MPINKWTWFTCSMALGMGLLACGPNIEKSSEKNKAGFEKYLIAHLVVIQPVSGKVLFGSDGQLGVKDSAGVWQREFTLGLGEKFMAQPDHHASSSFELGNIKTNSVELIYLSRFDHRSFGKNLITVDTGEIELPFKEKK